MAIRGELNTWISFTDVFVGTTLFVLGGLFSATVQQRDLRREVKFSRELIQSMNVATEVTAAMQRELKGRLVTRGVKANFKETEIEIPSAALFRSFGYDDFLNDPDSRRVVEDIGDSIQAGLNAVGPTRRHLVRVIIEGHTDALPIRPEAGTPAIPTNWELSGRRATGMLRFLEEHGLSRDRVQMLAVGMADTVPAASNDTDDGRATNRRIVIRIEPNLSLIQRSPQ